MGWGWEGRVCPLPKRDASCFARKSCLTAFTLIHRVSLRKISPHWLGLRMLIRAHVLALLNNLNSCRQSASVERDRAFAQQRGRPAGPARPGWGPSQTGWDLHQLQLSRPAHRSINVHCIAPSSSGCRGQLLGSLFFQPIVNFIVGPLLLWHFVIVAPLVLYIIVL